MPEYRAYAVGTDRHFAGSTAMRCMNDAAAIRQAKKLAKGRTLEIWRADRLVKLLEPNSK